jgi:hypothetical protein
MAQLVVFWAWMLVTAPIIPITAPNHTVLSHCFELIEASFSCAPVVPPTRIQCDGFEQEISYIKIVFMPQTKTILQICVPRRGIALPQLIPSRLL